MNMSRVWLGSAAVVALCVGAALADEPATPVAAPAKVEASPLSAPVKAPAPSPVAATPQPVAPKPSPAAAPVTPAASPVPAATPAASPSPLTTPAAVSPGDVINAAPIPAEIAPKPKHKPAPPPLETALSTDPHPTFTAETFFATQKAEERYAHIVEDGGWATDLPALRPGSKGEMVAKLRRHLALEGDIDSAGSGAAARKWDAGLTAGVKHFQERMGLRQSGVISGATLKEINVPAEQRKLQLAASAARLSNMHPDFEHRYVVVNLPSTQVEAIEDGKVVHHYISIVGDPDHPSPEIAAHISVINLNPTWTVPTSIIKKEIIPHIQRDPSYLSRMKIRVLDGQLHEIDPRTVNWSSERAANYILRQDSGAGNSLGSIRIGMPNKPRRLHARHAGQGGVRPRLPLPQPRLRARAGRVGLRRLAARGDAGRGRPAPGTRPRCSTSRRTRSASTSSSLIRCRSIGST